MLGSEGAEGWQELWLHLIGRRELDRRNKIAF